MTGKRKKINFYTTKGIKKEISRTRYSKASPEDEIWVDTSQFPKLSRRSCSRENAKRAENRRKGRNLQDWERNVSMFGSFQWTAELKTALDQCFSVRVCRRPDRHMFTLWQKPAKNITKFTKLVYLINKLAKTLKSLFWET